MQDEVHGIQKNDSWRFVTLSPGHQAICDERTYKIKRKADGKIGLRQDLWLNAINKNTA